jgi:hypothetical protein
VSTRLAERNQRRADSTGTSTGPVSRERLGPTVTVLAIEQALAELGIHGRLSDMLRKLNLSRTESYNRVRAVSRSTCAE